MSRRRSGRCFVSIFKRQKSTSVSSVRSCASSSMITEYFDSKLSARYSRINMPSVMYLITVRLLDLSWNRTENPISSPTRHPTSSATRVATLIAATRRGCVQPTIFRPFSPASTMYCVSCVVFPLPVSPTTIRIWFSRIARTSTSRIAKTGSWRRCSASDSTARGTRGGSRRPPAVMSGGSGTRGVVGARISEESRRTPPSGSGSSKEVPTVYMELAGKVYLEQLLALFALLLLAQLLALLHHRRSRQRGTCHGSIRYADDLGRLGVLQVIRVAREERSDGFTHLDVDPLFGGDDFVLCRIFVLSDEAILLFSRQNTGRQQLLKLEALMRRHALPLHRRKRCSLRLRFWISAIVIRRVNDRVLRQISSSRLIDFLHRQADFVSSDVDYFHFDWLVTMKHIRRVAHVIL